MAKIQYDPLLNRLEFSDGGDQDISGIETNATAIALNTNKNTNVTTNLSETSTQTTVTVVSSDGTDATLASASASRAGVMTKDKFDEVIVNNSKTGITSGQASAITANTAKTGISLAQTTKLSNIETSATADQTDAQIETAYNNQVGVASLSEVQAGSSTAIKRFTPERVKQAIEYCLPELTKSIFVPTPIATDDFGMWEPGVAITITKIVVQGIGGTSTTFNINHSGGTDLFSSDKVATTSRQVFTSSDFSDASCTAANYIQYQASAISGTPTGIKITITYTED